ncbi:hypothetical protein BH24ACT5_BH24ACT5_30340 [soil metagenome]
MTAVLGSPPVMSSMKLMRTDAGVVIVGPSGAVLSSVSIDDVFRADDPADLVGNEYVRRADRAVDAGDIEALRIRAPIDSQEVWAAGVTYEVSRSARMEESETAADVYERVYDAARPELFLKATPHRVVGPGEAVRIRADSVWNVPEPELTLAVSPCGAIFGYTIGNDMSSRDIEGDNPLYLPQAKVYDACAALGPVLVVGEPPAAVEVSLNVLRQGDTVFAGTTSTGRIRRPFSELVQYLFRDNSFPAGCWLMTGAGIVPDSDITLLAGDEVIITIEGVGTLRNPVVQG